MPDDARLRPHMGGRKRTLGRSRLRARTCGPAVGTYLDPLSKRASQGPRDRRGNEMSRQDRDAWETYVRGEIARFYAVSGGVTYIWQNTPAADRLVARLGGDSELAAFSGPWHVIRGHLTPEFYQWAHENYGTERLTFSQWRARAIEERAELHYSETPEFTLGQLEELRRLTLERDALIREAASRGATKVAIADAIGLSRQQIHAIIAAGELAPVTPIRPGIDVVATETVMTADGEIVEVF